MYHECRKIFDMATNLRENVDSIDIAPLVDQLKNCLRSFGSECPHELTCKSALEIFD